MVTSTTSNTVKSQQEQKQQEMQSQQQMQEQQIQAQQQEQQAERDFKVTEAEKRDRKDILIAEIRAAGYGSMMDINQNEQSDYQDAMADIRKTDQYQQQTQMQREKQANDMIKHNQKMSIEEQKIQAQRDVANKQLEIARENKNKYDDKSSKPNKKK